MNMTQLKGNWHTVKGKLKQRYANLTENDLRYEEGREEELFGRLQKATGQTREELERFFDDCGC
jgi:uncharacterized protein YjbJ (UPF0337 family)